MEVDGGVGVRAVVAAAIRHLTDRGTAQSSRSCQIILRETRRKFYSIDVSEV